MIGSTLLSATAGYNKFYVPSNMLQSAGPEIQCRIVRSLSMTLGHSKQSRDS
jgi:hypothetical protein